jgi:hypothetical protein
MVAMIVSPFGNSRFDDCANGLRAQHAGDWIARMARWFGHCGGSIPLNGSVTGVAFGQ